MIDILKDIIKNYTIKDIKKDFKNLDEKDKKIVDKE
jgi:hypothetical protein